MKQFNRLHLSILYCTALSLVGCGGSSNEDASSADTGSLLTGYFTDSAVEGLNYKTNTQSGVTDVNGAFSYQAGESVVFSIGDFVLGESATAAPKMTPLDLIPDATLPTTLNELSPLMDSDNSHTSESIAFRTLNNMLTFLQALDSDKDASNGITVADGMAGILQSESIDFTVDVFDFRKIRPLKRIMVEAVKQDLISTGFIKKAGQALNHFYQVQQISNSFQLIATLSTDTDGDESPNSIRTYTYDVDGNQLMDSNDSNGDDNPDYTSTYTYDANSNKLTNSLDFNGDDNPDVIYNYTWDANGDNLTSGSESGLGKSTGTNTYDVYGNLLTRSTDSNGDKKADSITTFTYDADGNKLTESYDSNADGTPSRTSTSTYDANGNQLTYSSDVNADEKQDSINTFTYDANGNKLTGSYDYNGDGISNRNQTYTYDADGNLLTDNDDYNADDITDMIITYTYDADGNKLTYSYDSNADETPEQITTYTYDTDGNNLTYRYDSNGDGTSEEIMTYTYDANGNLLTDSYDTDGDETPNTIATSTYDADGNKLTYSYDTDGDGVTNQFTTYTYVYTNIASNMNNINKQNF
jgi:hypothetical protein